MPDINLLPKELLKAEQKIQREKQKHPEKQEVVLHLAQESKKQKEPEKFFSSKPKKRILTPFLKKAVSNLPKIFKFKKIGKKEKSEWSKYQTNKSKKEVQVDFLTASEKQPIKSPLSKNKLSSSFKKETTVADREEQKKKFNFLKKLTSLFKNKKKDKSSPDTLIKKSPAKARSPVQQELEKKQKKEDLVKSHLIKKEEKEKEKTVKKPLKSKVSLKDRLKSIFKRKSKKKIKPKEQELAINLLTEEMTGSPSATPQLVKLAIIAVVLGLVILAGKFAFSLYNRPYNENIDDLKAELEIWQKKINDLKPETEQVKQKKNFILSVYSVLEHRIYWNKFFEKLEKYTLPDVFYDGLSLESNTTNLTLNAKARTLEDVHWQYLIFQQAEDLVEEVKIVNFDIVEEEIKTKQEEQIPDLSKPEEPEEKQIRTYVTFSVELELVRDVFYK